MALKVVVTGSGGQLGQTLKALYDSTPDIEFYFYNRAQLDITSLAEVNKILKSSQADYCVNCAAFTNVEQSELDPDSALEINALGTKNLVEACKTLDIILIHISTDYVFDGSKKEPYQTSDKPNPINAYGRSKLIGEEAIKAHLNRFFIIRTSWLYSNYNSNFFLSIINKLNREETIQVTQEQKGAPTSTKDLAKFIYFLISRGIKDYGLYNFSNQGATTWYNFAREISLLYLGHDSQIKAIHRFPTQAKRPINSELDLSKTKKIYPEINNWKDALNEIIEDYKSTKNN